MSCKGFKILMVKHKADGFSQCITVRITSTTHFFLTTPSVLPHLPVDFVLCPLTLVPQRCLRPLWFLAFLSLSKSSLIMVSSWLEMRWDHVPCLGSFCLLRNHFGTLYSDGLARMSETELISFSVISPDLLLVSTWAILRARKENLLPIPLICLRPNGAFCLPAMFVFYTLKIWVNSSGFVNTNEVMILYNSRDLLLNNN